MPRLDSWEVKAEKAAARRLASQQRKQRKNMNRTNKAEMQRLMGLFDTHSAALMSRSVEEGGLVVHIWTDTAPSGQEGHFLGYEKNHAPGITSPSKKKKNGRARSNSESVVLHTPSKLKKNGRARSNSETVLMLTPRSAKKTGRDRSNSESSNGGGRRKNHPRSLSHGSSSEKLEQELDERVPLLCRNHFFGGNCMFGNKGVKTCQNGWHYNDAGQTLAGVLQRTKNLHHGQDQKMQDLLASSSAAVSETDAEGEGITLLEASMEMVYYISVRVSARNNKNRETQDENHDKGGNDYPKISSSINSTLSDYSCSLGSIVYLALNGFLVFDRNLGGITLSDRDKEILLVGKEASRQRSDSVGGDVDLLGEETAMICSEIAAHHREMVSTLPCQILEYFLIFLPDVATATLPRVCRGWNNEIGRSSPELWRQLMLRRGWPLPPPVFALSGNHEFAQGAAGEMNSVSAKDLYRKFFLSHYTAVRDVRAIESALCFLNGGWNKADTASSDAATQVFKATQGSPVFGNECIGVKVWSPSHALAAYADDNTLRLFKAVLGTGRNVICRQAVCVNVAPLSTSKKARFRFVAFDLDKAYITCLFEDEHCPLHTNTLTVVQRDDLISSGGSDRLQRIRSFNLRETIFDFLLGCEGEEHPLPSFVDYLASGEGDISRVYVNMAQNIVACGEGVCAFDIQITIPVSTAEEEADDDSAASAELTVVTQNLCVFSFDAGAILSVVSSSFSHHAAFVSLVRMRPEIAPSCMAPNADFRLQNAIVAVSSVSDTVLVVGIDHTMHLDVRKANVIPQQSCYEGGMYTKTRKAHRHVVFSASYIVVGDTLVAHDTSHGDKAVLSFHTNPYASHRTAEDQRTVSSLELGRDCRICNMELLRNEHILIMCEIICSVEGEQAEGGLGGIDSRIEKKFIYSILVHIPSRQELHRICLGDSSADCFLSTGSHIPIFVAFQGQTVAVGASSLGFALAGIDVTDIGKRMSKIPEKNEGNEGKLKKKKSRRSGRGGKKDGFARGMSLRG